MGTPKTAGLAGSLGKAIAKLTGKARAAAIAKHNAEVAKKFPNLNIKGSGIKPSAKPSKPPYKGMQREGVDALDYKTHTIDTSTGKIKTAGVVGQAAKTLYKTYKKEIPKYTASKVGLGMLAGAGALGLAGRYGAKAIGKLEENARKNKQQLEKAERAGAVAAGKGTRHLQKEGMSLIPGVPLSKKKFDPLADKPSPKRKFNPSGVLGTGAIPAIKERKLTEAQKAGINAARIKSGKKPIF